MEDFIKTMKSMFSITDLIDEKGRFLFAFKDDQERIKFLNVIKSLEIDAAIVLHLEQMFLTIRDEDQIKIVEHFKFKLENKEMGIPDLSLVTVKQMCEEIKKRKNLNFVIVWVEDNSKDNITVEGNGNPTFLLGLLTRATNLILKLMDQNFTYKI